MSKQSLYLSKKSDFFKEIEEASIYIKAKTKFHLLYFFIIIIFSNCDTNTENSISQNEPITPNKGTFSLGITIDNTNEFSFGRIYNSSDTDYFSVRILKDDKEIAVFDNYSDMNQKEELEVGKYQLIVSSGNQTDAAFNNPIYYAKKEMDITSEKNTNVEVVCSLLNAKVNISFSEELKAKFPNATVEVYNSETSLVYSENNEGFFTVKNNKDLQLYAKLKYGTDEHPLVKVVKLSDLSINDEIDVVVNYDPSQDQVFFGDIFTINEKDILYEIYLLTEGFKSVNYMGNWDTDLPLSQWDGVSVNEQGYIDSLYIVVYNDSEVISKLSYFDHLVKVTIRNGVAENITIPNDIFSAKSLKNITINNFSINFDASSFNRDIEYLKVINGNSLNIIDNNIANLSSLEVLQFHTFSIPNLENLSAFCEQIGNLNSLKSLQLTSPRYIENKIETPMSFKNLNDLEELSLNYFKGDLPAFIFSDLLNLEKLSLTDSYNGKIPNEIGNLNKLKFLNLRDNNLEGNLPSEIGMLSNLEALYLHNNKLSGEIPEFLADLIHMSRLDLSDNQFTGKVPQALLDHPYFQNFIFDEVNN